MEKIAKISPTMHRIGVFMLSSLITAISILMVVDTFGNPHSSQKVLGIDSHFLITPVALFSVIVNQIFQIRIHIYLLQIMKRVLIPTSGFLCVVLSLWDSFTPAYAVFIATRLHQSEIWYLFAFGALVYITQQSSSWWQKHYKIIIQLSPYVLMANFFLMSIWPFDYFLIITHEDGAVEWMQFLVLLVGGILCGYISQLSSNPKKIRSTPTHYFCMHLSYNGIRGNIMGTKTNEHRNTKPARFTQSTKGG